MKGLPMISLASRDAITTALADPALDTSLRALIGLRVWQADTDRRRPLGDTLRIVVVQPGDPPELIHQAVGFPICWEQADQPAWTRLTDHREWFELSYIVPEGVVLLVFVADDPCTDYGLRFNCLAVANRPEPGSGSV
jgi:hypothetical protein